MIFKSTQFTDNNGNIGDKLTWAFKENRFIDNTTTVKQATAHAELRQSLKQSRLEFEAFNQSVQRNMASGMGYADAMMTARNEVNFTSDAMKKCCLDLDELYMASDKGAVSQDELNQRFRTFRDEQKNLHGDLAKTQKGFKGLSVSTKAMFANIGAELAMAFAFQAIIAGWNKLNDTFKITPAKKIEAMETATNDYNDALSESSDNIKTIESLEDEFNSLAKGVDDAGRNIGLSADEYERYNEIVNELVAINPSLLEGYTAEGNAIVDRNNAIQDGIDKQKEYAEVARASYATIGTGDDIFAGSDANINKLQNKLRSNAEDIGRVFGDIQGDNIWKDSGILNSLTGYSIDFSSNKKSVDYLVDAYGSISDRSLRILQYTSQRKDLDEEDYALVQSALAENDALYKELLDYARPRLEWLNAYVSTINEETGKSLMSEIPQDLQDAFQAGLEEIAYSAKDSADAINLTSKLKTELLNLYESDEAISGIDSAGKALVGYQTALENAEEAKRKFDRSNKDDSDITEYNSAILNSVSSLRKLADEYEDTFPEISAVLDASADDIESYAKVNELSIKNAVNQFDDLIKAARGAKETFDNALAGGDYYTGVEAYKEIYDTMFNGQNELGNGSLSFWQGAEQILGNDYLQEVQYDIDTVKAKLKGLSSLLEGGAHGAALLGEELADAAGGLDFGEEGHIKDEFGNIIADVERLENGAIKFDIDKENISAVADILNISEETLTALLDSARQFSDVDFSNTEEIRDAINKAAKTNDGAIRGRDGSVYMDASSYATESGLSGTKLQDSVSKLKEMGIIITGVNDDVEVLKTNFQNIASYNKDGSLNLAETVESYHSMGTSATDLVSILTKVGNIDLAELGADGYDSIQDYVEEVYKAYDLVEENPEMEVEVENTEAIEDLNDSLNEMIRLMGGTPPINIKVNGEGSLKTALEKVEDLTDKERESIINVITQYNKDGNLNTLNQELNKILGNGDSNKKTLVMDAIVQMSGGNLASLQGQLQEISKQSPSVKITDNTSTVVSNIGKVNTKLNNIDGKTSHVYIKTHKSTVKEEDAVGTPGRRIFKAAALGTIGRRIFGSVAKGKKGKLGANGRGGLTLTGELGPELVYIPSKSHSFMVGMSGPEMVDLPGDAVVYTADETKRIVGDTISLPKPRFDSLVKDNKAYKYGSAGGGVDGTLPSLYTTSSSSSSSKKKSKKKKITIDNYDKDLAALEHQLEMGYISEVTYYKKLQALYKKYKKALKKNTEAHRESLQNQHDARIDAYESEKDALDYKLEMGLISETTYYKKLKTLGDKYYKNQKGYTDEWKEHLKERKQAHIDAYEAEKDALDHKLEMGLISEATYFTRLQTLGKKYYKNRSAYSDEWNAHLEEEKDASISAYEDEAEALEKKLEKGQISLSTYYKKINYYQKKYLSGKAFTDELADANEDELDKITEGLDKIWDDAEQKVSDRNLFNTWIVGGKSAIDIYDDAFDKIERDSYNLFENEKDRVNYMIEKEREYAEAKKSAYEDQQDQLNNIIDLVEAMIRQETQDQIDALEKQKDSYSDIIDAKKESLRITEQELSYQEEMDNYATDIAKLQSEIATLALDDSRSAQALKAEKEAELAELLKEQGKAQREETISRTEDALDRQDELFSQIIDKAIEKLEAFLSNKSAVLNVVMDTIEQRKTNNLLERLIAYNGEHGDGMKATVNAAMRDLNLLVGEYGKDIEKIVETLQKGINVKVTGGIISVDDTDYSQTQADIDAKPITAHHTGLATGFVGDGADLKQHEVYRLLTDDELVFNRDDQMRIASQLQMLDTIKSSFDSLSRGVTSQPAQNNQSIELVVNAPITIEGNASSETVDEIKKALSVTAENSLDRLTDALRINGVHSRVMSNLRKN